jgi:hypothetical protein
MLPFTSKCFKEIVKLLINDRKCDNKKGEIATPPSNSAPQIQQSSSQYEGLHNSHEY